MFEKILVPLDGSELAEGAIPYVRDLASQIESEVYLLHACAQEHQKYLHMHQIYLNSIADGLRHEMKAILPSGQEPKVQSDVIIDEPVKTIIEYVQKRDISLIALTTYGTSGIRSRAMGNIADKVIREVDVPCLLIRTKEKPDLYRRQALIRRILVPLDSSEASQVALPYAIQMAKKLNASIKLFSMAQTIYSRTVDGINGGLGGGIGVNWDAIDASTEQAIEGYLQKVENEVSQAGVEVSHTTYLGMDAAYEILEMEKKVQSDLVVMATRGRSPIARWAFGSTAEKVLREGNSPILLVRRKGE